MLEAAATTALVFVYGKKYLPFCLMHPYPWTCTVAAAAGVVALSDASGNVAPNDIGDWA